MEKNMIKYQFSSVASVQFSSVQFSHSVVSNTLRPHELQHAMPCPTPTPRAHPNSCPLSWWCHPTISSSGVPFSSSLQSFPASGLFQMRKFRLPSTQPHLLPRRSPLLAIYLYPSFMIFENICKSFWVTWISVSIVSCKSPHWSHKYSWWGKGSFKIGEQWYLS